MTPPPVLDRTARPAGGRDARTRASARLRWRLVDDPPRPGARNMALDHALALHIDDDEAVLRLYAWARPTISFGRNEPARGLYSEQAATERALDCVRRPTGGRAVLHHHEVTYAVIAPWGALGTGREAYRTINEVIAAALASLGAPVSVAGGGPTAPIDAGPCFQGPAPGEVVAAGRKLVGSAQARLEGRLLQHGSIILAGDQSALAAVGLGAVRREASGGSSGSAATLAELAPGLDRVDVVRALAGRFEHYLGGHWTRTGYDDRELRAADRLEAERYGTREWTWRR